MSGNFEFSGLSNRPPGRFVRIASRVIPGVGRVENEIAPYAAAWHEHNVAALGSSDRLWVVLGDSLSQGVGASSIEQGWVLQTWRALLARGIRYRVVNLSISGARVADVLERELPAMAGLAAAPDLVTVLVGSNDVVNRELRAELPAHYRTLLSALPVGSLVGVVRRDRGVQAEVAAEVDRAQREGRVVAVPVMFAPGRRAADHFHPDDAGYAAIAEGFTEAIAARE